MKRVLAFLTFFIIASASSAEVIPETTPITNDLRLELNKSSSNGLIKINIRLKQQFDVEEYLHKKQNFSNDALRNHLVSELKFFSSRSQRSLFELLLSYARVGEVAEINSLWIANVINCYAMPKAIFQLALHPDLERIDIDEERVLIDAVTSGTSLWKIDESGKEIPYHVANISAPAVWAQGYTGNGVVVAVLDSGINYNHADLIGNLWTTPDYPLYGWNFIANNNNPHDDNGHGTHCAGIVAASGASGTQCGIAPGAKLMALKVLSANGSGFESGIWAAIQFAMENGAHVLSMSLGWLHAWNPDRATWRNAMKNCLAAGVVAAVAAGNEGNQLATYPIPDNVRTPGDCPPPWLHPHQTAAGSTSAAVCVGAVNGADSIAGFSARGPVTWLAIPGYRDFPLNPGIGLIRPDVVAPGVSVKSLRHDSNTGYTVKSGTSMATPCVAGVMALMLSKNLFTEPAIVSQILEQTAAQLAPVKNNVYGSGRVDALAAVNSTNPPGPYYHSHFFVDSIGNQDGRINPGETVMCSLGLINKSQQPQPNIKVVLRVNSSFITISDSVEIFGNFDPGSIIFKENAFRFHVSPNVPNGHAIKFSLIASNDISSWSSHFKTFAYTPVLGAGGLTIIDALGNANNNLDPSETAIIQFPLINTGKMKADDVQANLSTSNPNIIIHDYAPGQGSIDAETFIRANFRITVLPGAPVGSNAVFFLNINSGNYTFQKQYIQKIGSVIEDFESADFTSFNWTFEGTQPWTITSQDAFEGLYAARSGNINHNQTSSLALKMTVPKDDFISFKYMVSSQQDNDYLKFYIDNELMGQWSGELSWQSVMYSITPGIKQIRWDYVKNDSVNGGRDAAWLDNIALPRRLVTAVYAGPDTTACSGKAHQLEAIAMNYDSLLWSTSGNGIILNQTLANALYIPGTQDLSKGKAVLRLTAKRTGEEPVYDELTLYIRPGAIARAGRDTLLCSNIPFLTQVAEAHNHASITWISSGDGVFENPNALHTNYMPGEADIAFGLVTLTLTVKGILPCGDASSQMCLSLVPSASVDIFDEIVVCKNSDVVLQPLASNYSSALWTTSGSGNFDNPYSLNATYIPGNLDFIVGSVTLTITVMGNGPCGSVSDNARVVFRELPQANMSGPASICQGAQAELNIVLQGVSPWVINFGPLNQLHFVSQSPYKIFVQPIETTVYKIHFVTDMTGCYRMNASEITLAVHPLPLPPQLGSVPDTIDIILQPISIFNIVPGHYATSHLWILDPPGAGTISSSGNTIQITWNQTFIGQLNIKAKSINSCGESALTIIKSLYLKNTTSLESLGQPFLFDIYPNPSHGVFGVRVRSNAPSQFSFAVYDLEGRIVYLQTHSTTTAMKPVYTLPLGHLENGIYFLHVEYPQGRIFRKLIINR